MSEEERNEKSIEQREENNLLLRLIKKAIDKGLTAVIGLLIIGISAAVVDHWKLGQVETTLIDMKADTKSVLILAGALKDRVDIQDQKIKDKTGDRITYSEVDHWGWDIQRQNNEAGNKIIIPEPRHLHP